MRVRNSTPVRVHEPSRKRSAHRSLARIIKGTGKTQNSRHVRTLRDNHAQWTKRLKMSDSRAPPPPRQFGERRAKAYLTASIFLSHRLRAQLCLTRFRLLGNMRNKL